MARKSVATPEGVIRYFLTTSNMVEALNTFRTVRTILETQGVLAKRKPAPKAKEAGFVAAP